MPKKKISKKRSNSSYVKSKAIDYNAGDDVGLTGLKEALIEALLEADFDTFKGCIAILLEKRDYKEITARTGLSKSTLYRMCEPDSNPTLENIGRVMNYINEVESEQAA